MDVLGGKEVTSHHKWLCGGGGSLRETKRFSRKSEIVVYIDLLLLAGKESYRSQIVVSGCL